VGKSTVISLIARFYDPVSGEILLDGMNIKDITISSLRNQISIVFRIHSFSTAVWLTILLTEAGTLLLKILLERQKSQGLMIL